MKRVVSVVSILALVALLLSLVPATTFAQGEVSCESDVVVQADDWLSKIADKFLGDVLAYTAIMNATNAMAATDDSYAKIADPNVIEPGWKLCVPPAEQAAGMMATGVMPKFDKEKILADGKITIAWIPKALNNPVFEIGKVGAETKAKELTDQGQYGVEILYTASVASDAAEQARIMEDVIAKGVDAIGVSCNDPTACEEPINKAIAAGIPVMTWDSDSPKSQRFTYLGVDNYEGGKAAAALMLDAMPDGGKVALLTGVPGAFNLEERMRGFKDGIAGSSIEIVTTVACNDDINQGVQVVEETMQAYPDLNGWFFVGVWPLFAEKGSMPLWEGAAQSGKVKTVAFDTLEMELPYVKEGMIYGLVGQKYWGWGYDTTQMVYDMIVNGKTYESFTYSGMDIVTAKNVDAMAEAWKTQNFTKSLPPYK